MDAVQLEIRMNNTASNDPCAICGERTDPIVGLEIFTAGTYALVCHTCARQHDPALVDLVEQSNALAAHYEPPAPVRPDVARWAKPERPNRPTRENGKPSAYLSCDYQQFRPSTYKGIVLDFYAGQGTTYRWRFFSGVDGYTIDLERARIMAGQLGDPRPGQSSSVGDFPADYSKGDR